MKYFSLKNGITKYNDIIGKCIYRSNDTTMCSFMIDFIKKLKIGMYTREEMNAVLEHLRVLQVKILFEIKIFIIIIIIFFFRQLYQKIQMNYFYVLHIFLKSANHHH